MDELRGADAGELIEPADSFFDSAPAAPTGDDHLVLSVPGGVLLRWSKRHMAATQQERRDSSLGPG